MNSLELIFELAKKDYKLKYKNLYFGYFWSFFNPIFMILILYIVFSYVIKLNIPNFQIFLLIGVISWNYFSEATINSINSIYSNFILLKKQKIEPYVLVISSCTSSLATLFQSFVVLIVLMYLFSFHMNLSDWLILIYIVMFYVFTVGTSLLITGIYILFKDIQQIWSFMLLIIFWVSPIVYSESSVPDELRKYFMVNPIARIISHMRNLLIYNYTDALEQIFITGLLCIIVFFLGIWVFSMSSKNIGEKL